jgi:predicted nucleic acid-binding protein
MIVQFVDTYYLLALVNSNDPGHEAVLRQSRSVQQLVTTAWVLVEFADALASINSRLNAAGFVRDFLAEPFVELIPPTWG